jgi:hypothetical protein
VWAEMPQRAAVRETAVTRFGACLVIMQCRDNCKAS